MNQHRKPRRYGDSIMCSACGLQWDVTDPEPPECTKPPVIKSFAELFKAIDASVNKR